MSRGGRQNGERLRWDRSDLAGAQKAAPWNDGRIASFPFAGMTRIRFDGSSANAELSAGQSGSPNVEDILPQ